MATSSRLDLVDALRGFAIVSIMMLHNIEHFDLYFTPPGEPAWLAALDKGIWSTLFALFGGKSYAIFALLFGVTFHLQCEARARRGEDFRPRFAWRMLLLLAFGLINTAFYPGDILSLYAVLGLTLIPVAHWRSGPLLLLACLLSLQPLAWIDVLAALGQPTAHLPVKLPNPDSWAYFGRAENYMKHGSMVEVWFGNLTNGKLASVLWSWENGRILQIPALFMFGMVAARAGLFAVTDANARLWRIAFIVALLAFLPLYGVLAHLDGWIVSETVRRPLTGIVEPLSKLAAMTMLVTGFALLYRPGRGARILGVFRPLGQMSLTSYMMQSIAGALLYYGYGLGLYEYTGSAEALLIGVTLALLQGTFSAWWLRSHRQGPLEALWHRLTWIGAAPAAAPGPAR